MVERIYSRASRTIDWWFKKRYSRLALPDKEKTNQVQKKIDNYIISKEIGHRGFEKCKISH